MEKVSHYYSQLLKLASTDESASLILLESLWPQIVGKEIARCSHPQELITGNLSISVTDPAWKSELNRMTKSLKQAINRFWGMDLVTSVSFSSDDGIKFRTPASDAKC